MYQYVKGFSSSKIASRIAARSKVHSFLGRLKYRIFLKKVYGKKQDEGTIT